MVLLLLRHRAHSIRVGEEGWVDRLTTLTQRFYKEETVTEIRTEALGHLETLVCDYVLSYEDELMRSVVLPLFSPVADDLDIDVRCRAVQLLLRILNECSPQWSTSLLNFIDSVSSCISLSAWSCLTACLHYCSISVAYSYYYMHIYTTAQSHLVVKRRQMFTACLHAQWVQLIVCIYTQDEVNLV